MLGDIPKLSHPNKTVSYQRGAGHKKRTSSLPGMTSFLGSVSSSLIHTESFPTRELNRKIVNCVKVTEQEPNLILF